MKITIPERVFKNMRSGELEILNRTRSDLHGAESISANLLKLDTAQIATLRQAFERIRADGSRQSGALIKDIDRWTQILTMGNVGHSIAGTLEQFADLLTEYIRVFPGYRIYNKPEDSDGWLAHYVNFIEFHHEIKPTKWQDRSPAYVVVVLIHWELGHETSDQIRFVASDVEQRTTIEALAAKGFIAETKDLRQTYLVSKSKFDGTFAQIGQQYLTRGYGYTMDDRGWFNRSGRMPMMRDGTPVKVIVDITNEVGEKRDRNPSSPARPQFWASKQPGANKPDDSNHLPGNQAILQGKTKLEPFEKKPEIPIHPYICIYHLDRHVRFRVHVDDLEKYEYDKSLIASLILPQTTKDLVSTLIGQGRVSFQDIISGKGAGACVILGGPPGVGKTLTAEVFAEATERPLLSVQAAQLGTSPDTIEKNLIEILRKASRWNAVVLLDEADVYIGERGTNLQQNAIVAAFLRVLEHHTATIFMTTNFLDKTDDAIASRCIARIQYQLPDLANQKAIWHVLNDLNETGLTSDDINVITENHQDLSGRDIKQLLKLGTLWAANHEEIINVGTINFVRQFLPTTVLTNGTP